MPNLGVGVVASWVVIALIAPALPSGPGAARADPISPIIYVNRCPGGCTFTKATTNDALSNQTVFGGVPVGTVMTVSPFAHSEAVWNAVIACVREVYQPFNVQVVTEDPGPVPHQETVLAGRASELSLPGVLSIGAAHACEVRNNDISITFANDFGPDPIEMCWNVALSSGRAYGLDTAFECSDAMTFLNNCVGPKFFRNLDVQCGEFGLRDCQCGATQNSYQTILGIFGASGTAVPAPTVDITIPADGTTDLPRTFSVFAKATDRRGVRHLELWINGWKWAEVPGVWQKMSPYQLDLPAQVPDGVMDLEVRGCGDTGVCGADHITVTRGAPCTDATTCLGGQTCAAGKCLWEPTGELGEACVVPQQCASDLCADLGGGQQICSEACVGGGVCPAGFECQAPGVGQDGTCAPIAAPVVEDEGGCCAVGGDDRGPLLANLGLGGAIGLLLVRRRRRRR